MYRKNFPILEINSDKEKSLLELDIFSIQKTKKKKMTPKAWFLREKSDIY